MAVLPFVRPWCMVLLFSGLPLVLAPACPHLVPLWPQLPVPAASGPSVAILWCLCPFGFVLSLFAVPLAALLWLWVRVLSLSVGVLVVSFLNLFAMNKSAMLFDPCKVCALRGFCGDECGRLGFAVDSPRAPRVSSDARAAVARRLMQVA